MVGTGRPSGTGFRDRYGFRIVCLFCFFGLLRSLRSHSLLLLRSVWFESWVSLASYIKSIYFLLVRILLILWGGYRRHAAESTTRGSISWARVEPLSYRVLDVWCPTFPTSIHSSIPENGEMSQNCLAVDCHGLDVKHGDKKIRPILSLWPNLTFSNRQSPTLCAWKHFKSSPQLENHNLFKSPEVEVQGIKSCSHCLLWLHRPVWKWPN